MNVNPYCHGQHCNPLNLLFMMFPALICRSIHALLLRAYLSVS